MGFLKKAFDFVRSPTHSRTTAVIVLFLIFAAIPLTVIISQQQQRLRQRAAEPSQCQSIANIPDCNFSGDPACDKEGKQCKLLFTIYECRKQ